MKKLGALLFLVALGLAGYFFASPYVVLQQLKTAVDEKDAQTIIDHIDFEGLKSSVKSQLNAELQKQLPQMNLSEQNPQSFDDSAQLMGAMLAGAMINGIVDNVVSPNSIETLINTKDLGVNLNQAMKNLPQIAQNHAQQQTPPADNAAAHNDDWQIDTAYRSMNEFGVTLQRKDSKKAATVVLSRDGLFDWKISGVELPLD